MSVFMSGDELIELTGYRRKHEQKRWLTKNGYRFDVAGNGMPKVLWQQLIDRQTMQAAPQQQQKQERTVIRKNINVTGLLKLGEKNHGKNKEESGTGAVSESEH